MSQLTRLKRDVGAQFCIDFLYLCVQFFHAFCLNHHLADLIRNDFGLTLDVIVLTFDLHLVLLLSDLEFFEGVLAVLKEDVLIRLLLSLNLKLSKQVVLVVAQRRFHKFQYRLWLIEHFPFHLPHPLI